MYVAENDDAQHLFNFRLVFRAFTVKEDYADRDQSYLIVIIHPRGVKVLKLITGYVRRKFTT